MDVRIGVTYTAKEIEVPMADGTDPATIKAEVDAALVAGGVLWLTDRKGRSVGVPAEKIAYVDLAPDNADRRIGFAS